MLSSARLRGSWEPRAPRTEYYLTTANLVSHLPTLNNTPLLRPPCQTTRDIRWTSNGTGRISCRKSLSLKLIQFILLRFLQMYCFSFGWISIGLSCCLLYLLFNHSSMYSKEFRNAIALYHVVHNYRSWRDHLIKTFAIINDVHDCYLFTPYPLFPMPIFVCHGFLCRCKAPRVLLMVNERVIYSIEYFS